MTHKLRMTTGSLILAVLAVLGCAAPAADGRDAAPLSEDYYAALQIHANANAEFAGLLPSVATCLEHEEATFRFFLDVYDIGFRRSRELETLPQEMAEQQMPRDNAAAMEVLIHEHYDNLVEEAADAATNVTGLTPSAFYYCANFNEQHMLGTPCSETLSDAKSMAAKDRVYRHATLGRLQGRMTAGAY